MNAFDRVVASMMRQHGTLAFISVALGESYDTNTSENTVRYQDYPVNAMFFDYIRKNEGLTSENNTLIQSGDKQVYVQPPQKNASDPYSLPHILPNKDFLKLNGRLYKIVALKQLNPSMSNEGCVLYELYIRE